jgi:hypothetical protein
MNNIHRYINVQDADEMRTTEVRSGTGKHEIKFEIVKDQPHRKINSETNLNCKGCEGKADVVTYVRMNLSKAD